MTNVRLKCTFVQNSHFEIFRIEILNLFKPWPHGNFHKCFIWIYIWARFSHFIIIMRNKILILLFASTCAEFLDLVLPKTCPWVFHRPSHRYNRVWAHNWWVFRDENTAAKCEGQCELAYVDCTLSCSDTNCLIECGRLFNDCVNGETI